MKQQTPRKGNMFGNEKNNVAIQSLVVCVLTHGYWHPHRGESTGSNVKHIAANAGSAYSTILSEHRGGIYRQGSATRK
jgi:hypothetical protein